MAINTQLILSAAKFRIALFGIILERDIPGALIFLGTQYYQARDRASAFSAQPWK